MHIPVPCNHDTYKCQDIAMILGIVIQVAGKHLGNI